MDFLSREHMLADVAAGHQRVRDRHIVFSEIGR